MGTSQAENLAQNISVGFLLILSALGALGQPLDLQLLSSLQKGWQLLLSNIHLMRWSGVIANCKTNKHNQSTHLSSIHELQDSSKVSKGDVLEDDDWVLGWVLLQQVLEVGGASTQNHLVSFCVLTLKIAEPLPFNWKQQTEYLSCNGHITEAFLIPEVFEGGNHVGLEIVPSQTELLLVIHFCCLFSEIDFELFIVILITLRRYE